MLAVMLNIFRKDATHDYDDLLIIFRVFIYGSMCFVWIVSNPEEPC